MQLVRRECILSGRSQPLEGSPPGVSLQVFASAGCGAQGFSTGLATFKPGGALPYHVHDTGEAIVVLSGHATLLVEGRRYRLRRLDSAYIPPGITHSVLNGHRHQELVAHSAFASANPKRVLTTDVFSSPHERCGSDSQVPETIRTYTDCDNYELSPGAFFRDFFAKRFGSLGICGGFGRFQPGSSLPCHIHKYDESITIISGQAVCCVQRTQYKLSDYDTAFVPEGHPHRFINISSEMMEMIWVYAGDEPDRTVLPPGHCSGDLDTVDKAFKDYGEVSSSD